MRSWPVFVVATSLLWPAVAFGVCDQDEIDALIQKSQEAAVAWSANTSNKTQEKVQALSNEILRLTEEAQKKAQNGDTEASCQLIRDITALYK